MLKFIAKLWFCYILDEHLLNTHVNQDGTVVLRCRRCKTKWTFEEVLGEDETLK